MTTNPAARTRHLLCREARAGLLLPERRGAPGLPQLRLPGKGLAGPCLGCPQPPPRRVPSSPPPARPRGLREQIGIRAGGRGWWLE